MALLTPRQIPIAVLQHFENILRNSLAITARGLPGVEADERVRDVLQQVPNAVHGGEDCSCLFFSYGGAPVSLVHPERACWQWEGRSVWFKGCINDAGKFSPLFFFWYKLNFSVIARTINDPQHVSRAEREG